MRAKPSHGRRQPSRTFTSAPSLRRATRVLLVIGLAPAAAALAAVDPVSGLAVARSGEDLVLSWTPSPGPVDGYRVYKSTEASCANVTLVYQGAAPTATITGALRESGGAMYGVAAWAGSEESVRRGPVYRYAVHLPLVPGSISGMLSSLPSMVVPATSKELCQELNHPTPADPLAAQVVRSRPEVGTVVLQACQSPISVYNLLPGEAHVLKPSLASVDVQLWGMGDASLRIPLAIPFAESPDPDGCAIGLHFVSLPWDHAYADLQEIADEIPGALRVQVYDPGYAGLDCDGYGIGLSRPSSSDPWAGSNLTLLDRRGQGIVVAVESATEWTPRQLCTAFSGGPTANVPPVADAGGPYNSALCDGGVIGIWLDGSGSFDPDSPDPLRYQWSATCSGTIDDPTAAVTPAHFDCDPCQSLACEVTLEVTDGGQASASDSEPILSRQVSTCVAARNALRLTRSGSEIQFDWSLAPPSASYILLSDEDKAMGAPRRVVCGPALQHAAPVSGAGLETFTVTGMAEGCAPR